MPQVPAQSRQKQPNTSKPRRQKANRHSPPPSQPRRLPSRVHDGDPRFRSTLDLPQDGIASYTAQRDATGDIVDFTLDYINPAGCQAHNLERSVLLRKTCLTIDPQYRKNGLFEAFCEVVETGKPRSGELPITEELLGTRCHPSVVNFHVTKAENGLAVTWRDVSAGLNARPKPGTRMRQVTHIEIGATLYVTIGRADSRPSETPSGMYF